MGVKNDVCKFIVINIANQTGLISKLVAIGTRIGTIIYEISTKSIKNPKNKYC